jgi:hypothetical protein
MASRQNATFFEPDQSWLHSRMPGCQNVSHRLECAFMLREALAALGCRKTAIQAEADTFVNSPFQNPLDVKGGKWIDESRVDSLRGWPARELLRQSQSGLDRSQ